MNQDTHQFQFVDVLILKCECRPILSNKDKIFYAKLRAIESEQPKVIARSFKEFSSRIVKVDYCSEPGKCCLRGHHADSYFEDLGDYGIPSFLRKQDY